MLICTVANVPSLTDNSILKAGKIGQNISVESLSKSEDGSKYIQQKIKPRTKSDQETFIPGTKFPL